MTWFALFLIASILVVIVGMFVVHQVAGDLGFVKSGLMRVLDKAYDVILIPVARIGSASGHPSYFHTAKHHRS